MTSDLPAGGWLDAREQRAWRQWIALSARLPAALNRQLQADSSLSLPDFDVLVQLTDAPEGRLRITELADLLQWERSRLSHHLKRMAARGLLVRDDCVEDRRGAFARVTDAGREAIEDAAPGHVALVRRLVFDAMSPAEVEAFEEFGAAVLSALEAQEPVASS